jgi:hypothetical protein
MTKETRSGGFEETERRKQADKAQVGELTCFLQTIHGLFNAKEHVWSA